MLDPLGIQQLLLRRKTESDGSDAPRAMMIMIMNHGDGDVLLTGTGTKVSIFQSDNRIN